MVVDWFDLLKDEDPLEFRTDVIPREHIPEGFNPSAAYNHHTDTFYFPEGMYSRMADEQGQEAFETDFLNVLIHELIHQAQYSLDDETIIGKKNMVPELDSILSKIEKYFNGDPAEMERVEANPRYLITPKLQYNRNQNRRRSQGNRNARKIFTDEVSQNLREHLNILISFVDKHIKNIISSNILIETQAYLLTQPYKKEIEDFSERGTIDRNLMFIMIENIAQSAQHSAISLGEIGIRVLKNIERYANPQLTKFIRQKRNSLAKKVDEIPANASKQSKYIVNNILTKIQERFSKGKKVSGGKFVKKTTEKGKDKWMDILKGGCGCGCAGEEKEDLETVDKASARCTKRTKKTSSTRKGKKYMACVPNGKGGYKRVHWGDPNAKVTGKSGNTGRKRNFRARHNCDSCKRSDYSARCMACRDW